MVFGNLQQDSKESVMADMRDMRDIREKLILGSGT
jgi:hypothetical protein